MMTMGNSCAAPGIGRRSPARLGLYVLLYAICSCGGSEGKSQESPDAGAECIPGEKKCGDGNTNILSCNIDGLWESMPCPESATCANAYCLCGEGLVPGDSECVVPGARTCPDWATGQGDCQLPNLDVCPPFTFYSLTQQDCVQAGPEYCPEGWSMRDNGGCEINPSECQAGLLPLFNGQCVNARPVLDCGGNEPFGHVSGPTPVLYVWGASVAASEDGSRDRPYKTIAAALEAIPAGGSVLIGTGVYNEGLTISKNVNIIGRCPDKVTLQGEVNVAAMQGYTGSLWAVLSAGPAVTVELSGMTITTPDGSAAAGLVVFGSSTVKVHNMVFNHIGGAGVHVFDSSAELANNMFTGIHPVSGGSAYGLSSYGLMLEKANCVLLESTFDENPGIDLYAKDSTTNVQRCMFSGHGPVVQVPPMGLWIDGGTEPQVIKDCVFDRKMTHSIRVEKADVEISGNLITNHVTDYKDIAGSALYLSESTFLVTGNYFEHNQLHSMELVNSQGSAERNSFIDTLESDPGKKGGEAVLISSCRTGTGVVFNYNTIAEAARSGVTASDSVAELGFNHVEDIRNPANNQGTCAGISVVVGSDAQVHGNYISEASDAGIRFLTGTGKAWDNLVINTGARFNGVMGTGLSIEDDANLNGGVQGNEFRGNRAAGIYCKDARFGELADNIIRDSGDKLQKAGVGWGAYFENCKGSFSSNLVTTNAAGGLLATGTYGPFSGNVVTQNGSVNAQSAGMAFMNSLQESVETSGNMVTMNRFAGIFSDNADIQIVETTVKGNVPGTEGGYGIWIQGAASSRVRKTTASGNSAAGVGFAQSPDAAVTYSLLEGTKKGKGDTEYQGLGAVSIAGAAVTFSNNRIRACQTAGLGLKGGNMTIENNEITDNLKAAIIGDGTEPVVRENLIVGNGNNEVLMQKLAGPNLPYASMKFVP